jgi:hypothetical protein
MRINISVDIGDETQANDFIKTAADKLAEIGLNTVAHDGTTWYYITNDVGTAIPAAMPPEETTCCGGSGCDVCSPEVVEPTGDSENRVDLCIAKPMMDVPELPPEAPAGLPPEPEIEEPVVIAHKPVALLSLMLQHQIPCAIDNRVDNSVLIVPSVSVDTEVQVVRFNYAGFSFSCHRESGEQRSGDVVNPEQQGANNIRVVICFDGESTVYPCLIDVIEGDREELILGKDLAGKVVGGLS